MPLMPIYKDFFRFLDAAEAREDLWTDYERLYFNIHRQFLSSYWTNCIGLKFDKLRERVQSIRPGHYSHLLALLKSYDLESMCTETLKRCSSILRWAEEPTVYLIVGFFSPDGFVLPVENRIVIGIGLERYRSFSNLPVVLAHECCHYMQRLCIQQQDNRTLWEAMLSEGICIAFSKMVFPERPLTEHLGIPRGRLNWMRANEKLIWEAIKPALNSTGKDAIEQYLYGVTADNGLRTVARDIPGKAGLYMGFRIAEKFLKGFA